MTPDCRLSVAVAVCVSQLCQHTLHITHVHRHAHTQTDSALHGLSINELAGSLAQVLENANDAMLTY